MTGVSTTLIDDQAGYSRNCLREFKNLFVVDEAKFLLACLAKGFNPSFIIVGQGNLEIVLAYKSIKRTRDFLGAATSLPQAIDLLTEVEPGFIFIHERTDSPQYAEVVAYASQLPLSPKVVVLADSLELIDGYDPDYVDVFIADRDLFLPVNPLA